MAMKPKGALASAAEDKTEGPMHEQTEPPTEDTAEGEGPDGSGDSPGETEDASEGPNHEQTEPAGEDAAEGEGPDGSGDSPGEGALAQAGGRPDAAKQGLFETTLAHVMQALTSNSQALDQALQRDPIAAAVNMGTSAVRSVAQGASQATGKDIPFDVILAVGVTLIKKLADIANQKGYLPDEQIETFLKEAFQQSIHKWMGLDERDGKMSAGQVSQVQRKLGGASGAMMQG